MTEPTDPMAVYRAAIQARQLFESLIRWDAKRGSAGVGYYQDQALKEFAVLADLIDGVRPTPIAENAEAELGI